MENKKQDLRLDRQNEGDLFEISDYLWEHPELSMQEYEASDKLTAYLEKTVLK